MARSKAVARKPKSATGNQNEIKAGRVEKPEQTSTKENPALKAVVNKTPNTLRNQKKKRPISKKNKQRNKAARESLASGELAAEDLERRKERDLRTLYVRFKDKEKLPENPETVKNLHADIQVVRMPRQVQKRIQYAYLEFNSETKCEEAKLSIQKKDGFYVDYVGLKSKGGGTHKNQRGSRGKGKNKQVNPKRLFITGLIEGMTEDKLKELFPKCHKANIPKGSIRKGTLYGFVEFHSPADAKSAFEAAKKLTLQTKEGKEAQRITVLYATASNHPPASTKDKKSEKNEPKLQQINTENSSNITTTKTKNEVESKDAEMKNNEVGEDEESEDESEELENDKESEDEDNKELENDKESEDEENDDSGNDMESDDEADQNMENDADSDEDEDGNSKENNSDAEDNDEDNSDDDGSDESDE